jgi:hypothetical protein
MITRYVETGQGGVPCAWNRQPGEAIRMQTHSHSHDAATQQKKAVLAAFLGTSPDRIRESSGTLYGFSAFFYGHDEAYLVLTDQEATQAARGAVDEKLWFICLETIFAYFDIHSYPSDALRSMKIKEIRAANAEVRNLVDHSCGIEILKKRLIEHGNRRNLLADYDQVEHRQGEFFIYRLY